MKVKVGGVTANLEFLIENQRGLQIPDVVNTALLGSHGLCLWFEFFNPHLLV